MCNSPMRRYNPFLLNLPRNTSAGEPFDSVSAALVILRGGIKPLDLAEVVHAGGETVWSFLALLYGLPVRPNLAVAPDVLSACSSY